jgi:hypothetical protein
MLRNSAHLRSAAANLRRLPTLILLPFLLVLAAPATLAQAVEYNISITSRYNAQGRQPKTIREFFAANPNVHLKQWESLRMPGGAWTASLGMSMAGNRGPDIFEMDIRQAVSQNLAVPLTEWIGEDGVLADGRPKLTAAGTPDKNGQIDADRLSGTAG